MAKKRARKFITNNQKAAIVFQHHLPINAVNLLFAINKRTAVWCNWFLNFSSICTREKCWFTNASFQGHINTSPNVDLIFFLLSLRTRVLYLVLFSFLLLLITDWLIDRWFGWRRGKLIRNKLNRIKTINQNTAISEDLGRVKSKRELNRRLKFPTW